MLVGGRMEAGKDMAGTIDLELERTSWSAERLRASRQMMLNKE